jgi:Uncharacterized conserved protein
MVRVGVLANPDAGLGGRLGLKGSDGQADFARSKGAEDRSGPRMKLMLQHFAKIHRVGFEEIEWVTSRGRMGSDWMPMESYIESIDYVHESSGDYNGHLTLI